MSKRGEPFGIVSIEDYDGVGELALFGEDWGRWSGRLQEGMAVYITAKMVPRFANNTMLKFTIQSVEFLHTVREQRFERFTINVKCADINDMLVDDLLTMVTNSPGKTQLYFNINDEETGSRLLLHSRHGGIDVSKQLVQYIKEHEALSCTIN